MFTVITHKVFIPTEIFLLQHLFIFCRTGAFRHPNFVENAFNTKAGINLEKSSVLEGAKPKSTRGSGFWRDTPDVVSDPTREKTTKKRSGGRRKNHQDRLPFSLLFLAAFHGLTDHQIESGKKRGIEGRKNKTRSEAVPSGCRP